MPPSVSNAKCNAFCLLSTSVPGGEVVRRPLCSWMGFARSFTGSSILYCRGRLSSSRSGHDGSRHATHALSLCLPPRAKPASGTHARHLRAWQCAPAGCRSRVQVVHVLAHRCCCCCARSVPLLGGTGTSGALAAASMQGRQQALELILGEAGHGLRASTIRDLSTVESFPIFVRELFRKCSIIGGFNLTPLRCSMESAGVKLEQSNPRYDCASTVAVFRVDSSTGSAKSESLSYCDQLSPLLASRTPTWSTETPPREGEVVEETGSWLGAGRVVYSEPQSLRSCWLLVVSTLHDLRDLRELLSGCCAHDHVRHAPAPCI